MKMHPTMRYAEIKTSTPRYWGILVVLAVIALTGIAAAHYMDVNGHHVTGMNNQIVWGLPHVFAIFLIVAASGALNLASLGSVFITISNRFLRGILSSTSAS
jgi:molybdopterin-containing oxidoreductase family membrane subunit